MTTEDLTRVVVELRQALRPIESPYGESTGGPDGWSPEPDEIAEWEMTFREHATPTNVSTLLAALTLVQQERDGFREAALRGAAALQDMQQERDELRAALERLMRHFPTDADMAEAGWSGDEINRACAAHDAAGAVLTPKATQQEKRGAD